MVITRVLLVGALASSLCGCEQKAGGTAAPTPPPVAAPASAPAAPNAAAQAAPAPGPATPGAVIASGVIDLPKGSTATGKSVFVSVRSAEPGAPPMPLAAKKLPAGPFPLSFSLTEADRPMAAGRPIPNNIALKVTLDVDGNPMAKSPEDHVAAQTIKKGATGLSVTLNKAP